nr:putative GATA transcription factor 22 [Ipomoea batatas]
MIPAYMTSPFPFDLNYSTADHYDDDNNNDGDDQNPKLFFTSSSNYQPPPPAPSNSSSHLFLNYDPQFYPPPALNANDNWGSYDMEAKKGQAETGHNKRRKEEEKYETQGERSPEKVMMMPAKMKLVKKVRSSDRANMELVTNVSATKIEDHHRKGPSLVSSSLETDHSSNSSSSNNGGNNGNNVPIVRVCADCNTTKTPLWRSGPKGPKSLCNACGIRQRKARRAMAAAAAAAASANGGANGAAPSSPSTLKLKVQKTTAKSNNNYPSHHQQPLKKRCKFVTATAEASAPSSAAAAKNGVEDFLKKLSNSLALHRVFPQDEKDAAILLMAISCGLVHG